MLYVESRKSFKVRREKKLVSLPSAKQIHSTNIFLYRVPNNYTRQTYFFNECICLPSVSTNRHSANALMDGTRTNGCPPGGSLPSFYFCWVFFFLVYRVSNFTECFLPLLPSVIILPSVFLLHSTKNLFAKCPIKYTRQTFLHLA